MNEARISTYWSRFFGINRNEFEKAGVLVVPHQFLGDYQGAWIFKRRQRVIISVQPQILGQIAQKATASKVKNMFSRAFLNDLFGNDLLKLIGPVYQGYYDDPKTIVQTSSKVGQISFGEHGDLIRRLSDSGDDLGWSHSGINDTCHALYGYFHQSKIESIGCCKMLKGEVAFLGVFTNPRWRGNGFSQEVVRKMVQDLSSEGKLIRYQTLRSNESSVRLAQQIGFKEFASHYAVRLK